jgi:CheY-like chemotaxis protein
VPRLKSETKASKYTALAYLFADDLTRSGLLMAINPIIYIVDDGADYRFLLQQVFSRFLPDFRIQFFESGTHLHQHILTATSSPVSQNRPAFILLDLNMPGLSGLQTLILLKQQSAWQQVPVIMMTSEGSEEEVRQCYSEGVNSLILKPTDFWVLKSTIVDICQYWTRLNHLTYS